MVFVRKSEIWAPIYKTGCYFWKELILRVTHHNGSIVFSLIIEPVLDNAQISFYFPYTQCKYTIFWSNTRLSSTGSIIKENTVSVPSGNKYPKLGYCVSRDNRTGLDNTQISFYFLCTQCKYTIFLIKYNTYNTYIPDLFDFSTITELLDFRRNNRVLLLFALLLPRLLYST